MKKPSKSTVALVGGAILALIGGGSIAYKKYKERNTLSSAIAISENNEECSCESDANVDAPVETSSEA